MDNGAGNEPGNSEKPTVWDHRKSAWFGDAEFEGAYRPCALGVEIQGWSSRKRWGSRPLLVTPIYRTATAIRVREA